MSDLARQNGLRERPSPSIWPARPRRARRPRSGNLWAVGGLGTEGFIDAVRVHGEGLLATATSAGLDSRVPSCDDWVVRDLVRHIGGVHHWAARQLGEKRTDEIVGDLFEIVGGWPADDDLLSWAAAQHAALVAELEGADPTFPYFTWFRGDTPLTMWARRQAHETAVHRVDAELATGRRPTFKPTFAADGIDELLLDMIGDWQRQLPVDAARTLHVVAQDVERAWTITISPEGFAIHGDQRGDAHTMLRGTASSLYQALWGRGAADLEIAGDASVFDSWLTAVKPAWS